MPGKHQVFSDRENAALRAALRRLRLDRRMTQEDVGKLLGIKQQNAGRLLSETTNTGMSRPTGNALARALGFRDAEHFLAEHGVLAELQGTPAGTGWTDRDRAMNVARAMGYDEAVIQAIVARFTADEYQAKSMRWWNDKVVLEQLDRAADRSAQPPKSTPQIRPSAATDPTTKKARMR